MSFSFNHKFQCQNCRWVYEVTTRGHAMTEPPLLKGGSRTLHSELVAGARCHGILRYVSTSVLPPDERQLLDRCLQEMKAGEGAPSKVKCEAALATAWQKALNAGNYLPEQSAPEEFWQRIQSAQERVNKESAARRPKTAAQALDKAIADGAGRDGRTLAVAFNTATQEWKKGYSGSLGGVSWRRVRNEVQVQPDTPYLKPLIAALNGIAKKDDLEREVWVCAEVDAAAKALEAGWSLNHLSFSAAEYPGGYWRSIEACGHCAQWC